MMFTNQWFLRNSLTILYVFTHDHLLYWQANIYWLLLAKMYRLSVMLEQVAKVSGQTKDVVHSHDLQY